MKLEDLETATKAGSMDRREFIKKTAALGLSVPLASSLFTQSVQAATPKKGGKFIQGMGHGSTTDTLDPATYENGWINNTANAFSSTLFLVDEYHKTKPELVESFSTSADAMVSNFIMVKQ